MFTVFYMKNHHFNNLKGNCSLKFPLRVITLIKAKSNVFFDMCKAVAACEDQKPEYWRLGCRHLGLSLMLWHHNVKLKVFPTVRLTELITWDSQTGFYKRSTNARTWKSTVTSHIQDVAFDVVTSQRQTQSKMAAP